MVKRTLFFFYVVLVAINPVLGEDSGASEDKFFTAINEGNYLTAIDLGLKILEENPQDYEVMHPLAYALIVSDRFEEALFYLNTLLNEDGDFYDYYNLRGLANENLENYQAALDDYSMAIKLAPETTHYYYQRCLLLYDLGMYEYALEDINDAIKYGKTEDADHYNQKGNILLEMERYKEAAYAYEYSNKLNPNDYSFYNIAYSYTACGEFEIALQNINEAITLNPKNSTYYYERGEIYRNMNKYDEAILNYSKAISLDPDNASRYFARGYCYSDLYDFKKALKDYNKTISLYGYTNTFLTNRAIAYIGLGKYNNALADYEKALEIKPNNVTAYYQRSFLYIELGQYDKAIEDCKVLSDMLGDNPLPNFVWGAVLFLQGDYENSYETLYRYIEYYPSHVYAAFIMQHCAYNMDNEKINEVIDIINSLKSNLQDPFETAVCEYHLNSISAEDLIEMAGDNTLHLCESYYYIGCKMYFEKDYKNARKAFKQSIKIGNPSIFECNMASKMLEKL